MAAAFLRSRFGVAGRAAESIVASAVPTGTTVPGSTSSSPTTPSTKLSTSTAALEVSTTATTSPLCTLSPGFTSHSRRVPSSMSAPSDGIVKSAMAQPSACRAAATIVSTWGRAASSRCLA